MNTSKQRWEDGPEDRRSVPRRTSTRSRKGLSAISLAFAVFSSADAATLFFDDFDGTSVDSSTWTFPVGAPSYYGRTQIRATYPTVSNGVLRLRLDTHNPTALVPGDSFYGSEVLTRNTFAQGKGLSFEVRSRLVAPTHGGLVGGLFLYDFFPNGLHSEIDIELLSNQVMLGEHDVLTNVYANEPFGPGDPILVNPPDLDLTEFHIYGVDWLPGLVRWYVDGVLMREETDTVPTEQLELHLNLWAPNADFALGFDRTLEPVAQAVDNTAYFMEVDYVRISAVPLPAPFALLCSGMAVLGLVWRRPAVRTVGHWG